MSGAFWGAALSRQDGSAADGIHLLWTPPYAAGYSLSGYDIQRRVTPGKPRITCYTLTAADLVSLHTELRLPTLVGEVSVRATSCPRVLGALPDEPFKGDDSGKLHCVELGRLQASNIDSVDGAELTAFDATGARRPHVKLRIVGKIQGADCVNHLEIALPSACRRVLLTLVHFSKPSRLLARAADGSVVASASTSAPAGQAETITLAGRHITRVAVVAPADETLLVRLCWELEPRPPDTRRTLLDEPATGEVANSVAPAAPSILASSSAQSCLRYRVRLDGPRRFVRVDARVAWTLAIAMREGKAVDSRFVANASGIQEATFVGRGVDEVLLYTNQRISGLTICVDVAPSPKDENAEWASVPFIAKQLQLPLRKLIPSLGSPADELALATSRLVAGETLDAAAFKGFARTMNATLGAGPASPMWCTNRTRDRLEDPFVEVRPWSYALSLTAMVEWRRALGFGFLDAGSRLASGTHYDYRITGHFKRRDIEESLLAFHTVPSGTTLPATFQLGTVRVSTAEPRVVELYPPVPDTALRGFGRKGIRIDGPMAIAFDTPVQRVVLELEPALAGAIEYAATTSEFLLGLSGTTFRGAIVAAPRITLEFAEPIDTLELKGVGFLYGVRVLNAGSGNPDEVLDLSIIVADVAYVPTDPPQPPPVLGTTNLQQPILPGDPTLTTQNPPQSLGFLLRWMPPPPLGGTPPLWPPDLTAVPPFDVLGFHVERRRVDTSEPFVEIDRHELPTVFFGNRGAPTTPLALGFGCDLLSVFPEVVTPAPPVDPWISIEDLLRSALRSDGPPPGSLHQYRVFSIDAIGRRSAVPTTGSVVRLEKRIAPPRPPGPGGATFGGVVRPTGVRARVLQASDPDMPPDDVALLGSSINAVVLEWGWTDVERTRDPFASEFRVYWQPLPPDQVHGILHSPATLTGGLFEMACTLDQPLPADAMKGTYVLAGSYPFKVRSHTAGATITMRFEPSVLQAGSVPGAASFTFSPILTGAELRPGAWAERTAVVPLTAGAPSPFVFRDRLTLDALHPRARVWVGVSSADAQTYIPDEVPAASLNGGRPGNESSIAAVVAEGRYLGRPEFVVPPPLPDVPEDVSPEPLGPTVNIQRDLPALLPGVVIPADHRVVLERLEVSALVAALSRRADGTIGALFPDGTSDHYTLGNPGDQAQLFAEIATAEPARVENKFLMDVLLRFPAKFEPLWQRALPDSVPFGIVTETLPSKADRWVHRIRIVDPAGHISEGAAILPRLVRVASTRTPSSPLITLANSETDSLAISARMHAAFDLKWLVLFAFTAPDPTPLDARVREKAVLLRIPDRRDLYPNHGLRLRLGNGTLLEPTHAVDIAAAGTEELPDIVVPATILPGFAQRVSVWAVTMTRDGIPSRVSGPVTAHTGPLPLVVPGLIVTATGGVDNATWGPLGVPAEVSLERSTNGGASFRQVSPWLPSSATTYVLPGSGPRVYRLVLRGPNAQQTAAGPPVMPT